MTSKNVLPSDLFATPTKEKEVAELVYESSICLPIGGQTKPALSRPGDLVNNRLGARCISMLGITGVTQYQPSEFTFTAWAGTPIAEINSMLAENRQYLPFDPLLVRCGSTLGGTLAAGLSGPGRFRFGGVRDFVLGVRLVTGSGRIVEGGGKVVKNAAGFDLPKLLVGSLGRLGIMTELTFKVFPKPPAEITLSIDVDNHQQAIGIIRHSASQRWELDAIEYSLPDRRVYLRLRGPETAISQLASDIATRWSTTRMDAPDATAVWQRIGEFRFLKDCTCHVRVPITTRAFLDLANIEEAINHTMHLSVAGGLLWIGLAEQSLSILNEQLLRCDLSGLIIRGENESIWVGKPLDSDPTQRIKQVIDPGQRFPTFGYEDLTGSR